jgi:hypothetical protein
VSEIGLVEVSGAVEEAHLVAEAPFEVDPGSVTLRFLLSTDNPGSLEALRNARRALLREELTRGREPDEPSLEDAVFSASEILWEVNPAQRPWCLEKLEELRRRANLLLAEVDPL